jgi:hypothetical protein
LDRVIEYFGRLTVPKMTASTQNDDEDLMSILLATDIHLGFNEKHPERGNLNRSL